MSTPTGDNAFLYELELNVRTELTLAETSQPEALLRVGSQDTPKRAIGQVLVGSA